MFFVVKRNTLALSFALCVYVFLAFCLTFLHETPIAMLFVVIAALLGWDAALTDDEVAALAAGHSPLLIRPASLVAYWPLGGLSGDHDRDIVGGYDLTAYNSPTWADHPPVIYPSGGRVVVAPSAGGPFPHYTRRRLRGGMIGMGL